MMNQPRRGVASRQSAPQGFDGKTSLQAVTRGPADDAARKVDQPRGPAARWMVEDMAERFPAWAAGENIDPPATLSGIQLRVTAA